MSEDNLVYEITQMMSDKATIQNDMSEAMNMVNKMFKDKYISKLHAAVQNHHMSARNNPPKEAQLLQVLKQFSPPENHDRLDKMIDGIILMNTAQSIRQEMAYNSNPVNGSGRPFQTIMASDRSIHPDGVYDVDTSCRSISGDGKPAGEGMALLLAMLMLR